MKFIEETNYMRRMNQSSHDPHRSKEGVDYLLCSDPDGNDVEQVEHVHRSYYAATQLYMIVECLILAFFSTCISKHY